MAALGCSGSPARGCGQGVISARPALFQREARPDRILQATREDLDRLELTPWKRDRMSCMILEAEYVLGGPLRVKFALEEGRWYIASVGKDPRRRA